MPYDKQRCDIVVAVREDSSEVNLVPLPEDLQSQFNLPAGNPEWDLKSLTRNYKAIKAKIKSPTDSLRKRTQETKMEEAVEVPEVSDEAQDKILREVRIAAGRLGRLTLWGADMWIKDQYVDIFCRWVYLPLYAILAAISLNEST